MPVDRQVKVPRSRQKARHQGEIPLPLTTKLIKRPEVDQKAVASTTSSMPCPRDASCLLTDQSDLPAGLV